MGSKTGKGTIRYKKKQMGVDTERRKKHKQLTSLNQRRNEAKRVEKKRKQEGTLVRPPFFPFSISQSPYVKGRTMKDHVVADAVL
jgi:hypothetical protein